MVSKILLFTCSYKELIVSLFPLKWYLAWASKVPTPNTTPTPIPTGPPNVPLAAEALTVETVRPVIKLAAPPMIPDIPKPAKICLKVWLFCCKIFCIGSWIDILSTAIIFKRPSKFMENIPWSLRIFFRV